jgi:hypothetical protein
MKIQFQDINLEVIPDKSHEWLLETALVADGYGVKAAAIRMAKSRNEVDLIEGKHYVSQNVTIANGGQKPKIYWTKRGVITLGFFITSEKARQFRQWAEDLILKVLERPVDKIESLEQHTKREVQVQNSKDINRYLFKNWDRETLIEYNRKNCQMVSGYLPSELRKIGRANGLKSTQYNSGKEVLRNMRPELAAQMSLNDDLVQNGVRLTEANSLSAPCVPLLSKMIHLKMIKA